MRRLLPPICAAVLFAAPVLAQPQTTPRDDLLVQLSGVLGEAHALRQVCNGPSDAFWYNRMLQLLQTEALNSLPMDDERFVFAEQLRKTFNAGYEFRQNRHRSCDSLARQAEDEVTSRGGDLAGQLSRASQ